MTDFPPEHWDKCASDARLLADSMLIPEARKIMLEIAAGYECLAEAARRFLEYTDTMPGISGVKDAQP